MQQGDWDLRICYERIEWENERGKGGCRERVRERGWSEGLSSQSSLLTMVMSPGTSRTFSSATGRCGSRLSERAPLAE